MAVLSSSSSRIARNPGPLPSPKAAVRVAAAQKATTPVRVYNPRVPPEERQNQRSALAQKAFGPRPSPATDHSPKPLKVPETRVPGKRPGFVKQGAQRPAVDYGEGSRTGRGPGQGRDDYMRYRRTWT